MVIGGTPDENFQCACQAAFVKRLLVVCPPGVGRQALHPSSPPRLQRLPRLHRRKRDCTPTLFLTSSVCSSTVAVFFGGGRIGTSPFLLTMSRSSPEEEGQALLLLMMLVSSSEVWSRHRSVCGMTNDLHDAGRFRFGRFATPSVWVGVCLVARTQRLGLLHDSFHAT